MSNGKVLVVAFDGMDKELIEEYDLENIPQKEFGGIDNNTGIQKRVTMELFASFITGETYEEHGIESLARDDSPWKDIVMESRILDYMANNFRGFYRFREVLDALIDYDPTYYTKEDIEVETLFEKIDASLPLYVPSYTVNPLKKAGLPHVHIGKLEDERQGREEARRFTENRLRFGTARQSAFFDITPEFWDFVMLHLHDPDGFHDMMCDDMKKEYERLDEIAGEILEFIPDDWTVIFMSDHGKMMENFTEHNKNAFYSCNRELFGEATPHITDFHDVILDEVKE